MLRRLHNYLSTSVAQDDRPKMDPFDNYHAFKYKGATPISICSFQDSRDKKKLPFPPAIQV